MRVVSSSSSTWLVDALSLGLSLRRESPLPFCFELDDECTGDLESCRWRWWRRDEDVPERDRERRWRRGEPELNIKNG